MISTVFVPCRARRLTVDTSQGASVSSSDIVKDDVAFEHLVAISAGAVELAESLDGEA